MTRGRDVLTRVHAVSVSAELILIAVAGAGLFDV